MRVKGVCVSCSYSIVLYAHRFFAQIRTHPSLRKSASSVEVQTFPLGGEWGSSSNSGSGSLFGFWARGKQATSKLKPIYTHTPTQKFIIKQRRKNAKKQKKLHPFRAKSRKNQHTHVFIIIFCIYEASRKMHPTLP